MTDSDNRSAIYVDTDHNPDEIRSFYELPDELARLIQPEGDRRTFAQALADLCEYHKPIFTKDEIVVMQRGLKKFNRYDVPQAQSAFMKLEAIR